MKKTKQPLTETEIKFMELWSKVILKKSSVSTESIDEAASLINFKRSGTCSTCLRNDAASINNTYRQLLPEYNLYLDNEKLRQEIIESQSAYKVEPESNEKLEWVEDGKGGFLLKALKKKK